MPSIMTPGPSHVDFPVHSAVVFHLGAVDTQIRYGPRYHPLRAPIAVSRESLLPREGTFNVEPLPPAHDPAREFRPEASGNVGGHQGQRVTARTCEVAADGKRRPPIEMDCYTLTPPVKSHGRLSVLERSRTEIAPG